MTKSNDWHVLLNPGGAIDMHFMSPEKGEWERQLRENYATVLQAIAARITMKDDRGEYAYFFPAVIRTDMEVMNLDYKLMLRCVPVASEEDMDAERIYQRSKRSK